MANQNKKVQKVVKSTKTDAPSNKQDQLTFDNVSAAPAKKNNNSKKTDVKKPDVKKQEPKKAAEKPLSQKEERAQLELEKKIAELERQAAATTAKTTGKKTEPSKTSSAPVKKEQVENIKQPVADKPRVQSPAPAQTQQHREQPNNARKNSDNNRKKKKGYEERKLRLAVGSDVPFAYSEAYKSLRTNLNFIASTEDVRSIVITSAIPKESKSNVSVNLAMTLATEGKKVILVDCDFRQPVLNHYLKLGRHHQGFTDVIIGKVDLKDAITTFKDARISVLTAGSIPPNPSEMLAQKRTKEILDKLKENFDYVIIDAPPITVVTDAAILSTYVDGVIFVVRSKFAPIETLQLAKKRLDDVNARILGVVLTRFNAKSTTKNSAYTYAYGYGYGDGYGKK